MDEEYARKKELMDWIVAGKAGRHYPKPAPQDKTYVNLDHEQDDRPLLIKAMAKVAPEGKIKERYEQKPYSKQVNYNKETFCNTHGDVLEERLGKKYPAARERLKEMGDSLDKAHNLQFNCMPILGILPTPTGLYNKYHKEKLRDAFDEMGLPRK